MRNQHSCEGKKIRRIYENPAALFDEIRAISSRIADKIRTGGPTYFVPKCILLTDFNTEISVAVTQKKVLK